MRTIWALLQLTRLDSAILGFLAVFVPFFVRTGDFAASLGRAVPLLFICMCTFIANDLDDMERDTVNHPERPLPARRLSPTAATVLYFMFLAAALFATRHFVEPAIAFWYYALVGLSVSYHHVVDRLPSLKAVYAAAMISVPVLIVVTSYPNEPRLYRVAGSAFLFALGRELCMDIKDRAGDAISFLHHIPPTPLATAAFSLQAIGLLLVATEVRNAGDTVDVFLMTLLLAAAGVYWFKLTQPKSAIILMKLQFFVGLYLLT